MSSEIESAEQFAHGLMRLQEAAEWKSISEMPEITNRFNLFGLLEDAVCENAWSRIIAFLFDSTADHGLGLEPLKHWTRRNLDSQFAGLVDSAKASITVTEWGTFEGRRLDILVKVLDGSGKLTGIIGIENKVWSGEQPRQLKDYQEALMTDFSGVPKVLVFLTPDNREPQTAEELPECSVQRVSYDAVIELCEELLPSVQGDLLLLISSLQEYLNCNILRRHAMENRIKEDVSKLYQDKDHRRIIELIFEHRPLVRTVLEKVATSVEKLCWSGEFGSPFKCSHDYWPAEDESAPELRIWPQAWTAPKGSSICYMLRSWAGKPSFGDSFTVLVNACCDDESVRSQLQGLVPALPPRISHRRKRWGGWEVLWEGESYELRDLAQFDVEQLTALVSDAISKTIEPLRKTLLAMCAQQR